MADMPAPLMFWEDFHEGQILELGSRTVGKDEMLSFARAYDPQPFHLDPEAARASIFGALISSGWLTASLYMRLLVDGLLNKTTSQGSPGVDALRWLKPVFAGDTLSASARVLETRPSRSRPTIGIVKMEGAVRNQHGLAVLTLVSNGLFGRRPDAVQETAPDTRATAPS